MGLHGLKGLRRAVVVALIWVDEQAQAALVAPALRSRRVERQRVVRRVQPVDCELARGEMGAWRHGPEELVDDDPRGALARGLYRRGRLLRLLLEPRIVSETALRLSKYTVLVEQVLQHAEEPLPAGVLVRQQNQLPSGTPAQAGRFERLVEEAMAREFGLQRRLQRDQPPLQDPWGGHWVQLNRFDQRTGQTLWLFQSQLLSNSLWYLPPLRILAIVIGALAGLVLPFGGGSKGALPCAMATPVAARTKPAVMIFLRIICLPVRRNHRCRSSAWSRRAEAKWRYRVQGYNWCGSTTC